jgi:hypothetical protein
MPELIHGMPFNEYLALDRLSSSGLKALARSPAHFRHASTHPSPASPAQALGTHVHGLLLEPETYRYAVQPECDRRTKDGKGIYAAFIEQVSADQGINVVTSDQHEKAIAMVDAVRAQPYAAALLADGRPEVTALWEASRSIGDAWGIPCKARFDWLPSGHQVIVDLKTSSEADADGFSRAAARYKYHYQAVHYQNGAKACGLGDRPMIFIVVENEPPHAVALYTLDEEAVYAATYRIERLIEQYAECK